MKQKILNKDNISLNIRFLMHVPTDNTFAMSFKNSMNSFVAISSWMMEPQFFTQDSKVCNIMHPYISFHHFTEYQSLRLI